MPSHGLVLDVNDMKEAVADWAEKTTGNARGTQDDREGQGVTQIEKLLANIKARTITYEALDDDAETAAEQACDAWDELAEAYEAEDKELNRIDIEGE